MPTAPETVGTASRSGPGAVTRAWHRARPGLVLSGRVVLILATVAAIVVAARAAITRDDSLLALGVPLFVAGSLVLVTRQTYLVIRQVKWRARRLGEAAAVEALGIPPEPEVRRPGRFPGVDPIRQAKSVVMPTVPDYQEQLFLRGLTVAALPPIAVLLAAAPSFAPHLALGTSLAEVLVLLTAFVIVQRAAKPAKPWVAARTRTELLRREEYLRLALVGPYLNRADDATDLIRDRIARLDAVDEPSQARAIGLRDDPDGPRWIDQLWTRPYQPPPELRQRMLTYLHYRIRKQIVWFQLGTANADRSDRAISRFIKGSLIVGISVVLAQAVFRRPWPELTASANQVATLLALVLPTVSAFLLALRELYAYRGLAASYTRMVNDLTNEQRSVERLLAELDQPGADVATVGRQFQATVLHTEALLTHELERWIMIIDRDQFDLDG